MKFDLFKMIALMVHDYSFCEAFEKEGFNSDVSELINVIKCTGKINHKAELALRRIFKNNIVGDKETEKLYNSLEPYYISVEPSFSENFTVEKCKEFLRLKGMFVQNIWTSGDVIEHAEQLGYEVSEEQAIEIFDLMGRRFDATIGVNWESLETIIGEYFS